jgi:colanic acid biosynthesis glycosyl transferase WcaI
LKSAKQKNSALRNPKVLIITPQYAPDYGPSAPIYTWLSEDLARAGCEVTVVTAFPHYAGADVTYPTPKKLFAEERRDGVRIIRTYVYTVPKAALWGRLLYHGSFNLFSTLAALGVKKPDIVFADAPTLWSGLSLLLKSILPRVPFIYIMHDIYPDVLSRLGVLRNPRLIGLIERVEEYYYDRSAGISVLSEGFKENLSRKGVPESKISVIPVCVDVEFFRPLPRENELREKWGLQDRFVVSYAGNMGHSQALDTAIRAALDLRDHPEIVFVLVGEGASKPALQILVEKNGLEDRVRFFSFLPREEVPLIYALSDVCLVSLKRELVIESVPSKTYTIMASGRPILATVDQNTEVGQLLNDARCGFCTPPEDADSLAEAILNLYGDSALRREMGVRGRDYAVKHYAREVAAGRYYSLIEQAVNGRQG